jgi:hypothetical protein
MKINRNCLKHKANRTILDILLDTYLTQMFQTTKLAKLIQMEAAIIILKNR